MNSRAITQPAPLAAPGTTLALLSERMRSRGDMPAFTRTIGAILGAMRGEDDAGFDMTRTVLADPVLTHKVLRLANSGMYAAFGQRISTVTRAVMVLGTDAIGQLALGLKVIDEVSAPAIGAGAAREEMEKALLAGIVARQITEGAGAHLADGEEAVVCAMLHSLGRMMVAYYLPERWSAMQQQAGSEEQSAHAILGMTLEDLGRVTARDWGLPQTLADGMRSSGPRAEAAAPGDQLAAVSTLASRAAQLLWHDDASGAMQLAATFSATLGLAGTHLAAAIGAARQAAPAVMTLASGERAGRVRLLPSLRADGARMLVSGVADMREAAATARAGQMVSMALETLYKGLNFTRAVAFLRHRRDGEYRASMGFGEGVEQLLPSLAFSDKFAPDVFSAALAGDRVVFIRQARDAQFAGRLPPWWKASLGEARSFVILPLCRGGQPVGFLYGDWLSDLPQPQLEQAHFAALQQLRTMVVESVDRRKRRA